MNSCGSWGQDSDSGIYRPVRAAFLEIRRAFFRSAPKKKCSPNLAKMQKNARKSEEKNSHRFGILSVSRPIENFSVEWGSSAKCIWIGQLLVEGFSSDGHRSVETNLRNRERVLFIGTQFSILYTIIFEQSHVELKFQSCPKCRFHTRLFEKY